MNAQDFAALGDIEPAHRSESAKSVDVLYDVLTPDQGAATQVWAATSPQLDLAGGRYLADCNVSDDAAPYALDPERAAALWALSESLCS
ncbi:hypothetical protein [Mycobacteroides abscessus]|uniref:hypothetical protein n=1 Tax=Mycobacteroides abscessus TaxID=36809 RepID=UPI000C261735|nr:hypothetical protein [Mycobacteroides abscessus]